MKIKIIYDEQVSTNSIGQSCAYPLTTLLDNGKIVCVYRKGKEKHSYDGVWVTQISSDNGKNWSKPIEIFNGLNLNLPESVCSGGICQLSDRSLMTAFYVVEVTTDKYIFSEEGRTQYTKIYTARSWDEGKTWPELNMIKRSGSYGITSNPFPFESGNVLIPTEHAAAMKGSIVAMGMSCDFGKSVTDFKDCMTDPKEKCNHSDARFTICPDGTLMALLWTFNRDDEQTLQVHRSLSKDKGSNWSVPEPIGFLGQISSPVVLDWPIMLAASNYRHKPEGIRLWISFDGGKSWNEPIQLWDLNQNKMIGTHIQTVDDTAENKKIWDALSSFTFGTPNLLLLSDKTIFLSYYATVKNILHVRACNFKLER